MCRADAEAVLLYKEAASVQIDLGRFSTAAKLQKEIAELYEAENDLGSVRLPAAPSRSRAGGAHPRAPRRAGHGCLPDRRRLLQRRGVYLGGQPVPAQGGRLCRGHA